jgi:hypothetical protein
MNALAVVAPRIGRLIRLLGSDSDGECLADAVESSAIETRPLQRREHWRASARWLINSGAYLSPKERAFAHQMAGWTSEPSERQAQWLEALVERASRQRECA